MTDMAVQNKVRTCFWYNYDGEEAVNFYVSLLPDSRIESMYKKSPGEPALMINFILSGVPYQILNAGPNYPHTEAASITVTTEDQEETDRLWNALIADGGEESMCGWLKDRFGLSWQIVPRQLPTFIGASDEEARGEQWKL